MRAGSQRAARRAHRPPTPWSWSEYCGYSGRTSDARRRRRARRRSDLAIDGGLAVAHRAGHAHACGRRCCTRRRVRACGPPAASRRQSRSPRTCAPRGPHAAAGSRRAAAATTASAGAARRAGRAGIRRGSGAPRVASAPPGVPRLTSSTAGGRGRASRKHGSARGPPPYAHERSRCFNAGALRCGLDPSASDRHGQQDPIRGAQSAPRNAGRKRRRRAGSARSSSRPDAANDAAQGGENARGKTAATKKSGGKVARSRQPQVAVQAGPRRQPENPLPQAAPGQARYTSTRWIRSRASSRPTTPAAASCRARSR